MASAPCEGLDELKDLFEQRDDVYNEIAQELKNLPLAYYKKIKLENTLAANELQYKWAVNNQILETLRASERYAGSDDVVSKIFEYGKLQHNNTLHFYEQKKKVLNYIWLSKKKRDTLVLPHALTKNIRLYAAIEDRIRLCSPKDPVPEYRSYAYKLLKTIGFNTNPKETIQFFKNELKVMGNNSKQPYRLQLIIDLITVLVRHTEDYESNKELLKELLHGLPTPQLVEAETFLRAELEREKDSNKQNFLRLLMSTLYAQKNYTNVAYVLKENYQDKKETLALAHPITQQKLKEFITFLMKTEQYAIAEAFLEKEIATEREPFEIEQFSLLLNLLANVFLLQKKYADAEPILNELFNIYVASIRKVNKTGKILLEEYPALKRIHDLYTDSIQHHKDEKQQRVLSEYIDRLLRPPIKSIVSTTLPTNIARRLNTAFKSYIPVKPPLTDANKNEATIIERQSSSRSRLKSPTPLTIPSSNSGSRSPTPLTIPSSRSRSGSRNPPPASIHTSRHLSKSVAQGGGTKKAPSSRRMTKSLCPSGQVLRFGSTRKLKKGSKKYNRSTRKLCAPGIGKLKEGQLAKFGYVNVVHKTTEVRRAALDKAVKEFGALSVFRKLNAVYVYGRRSAKESSKIFKEDRDWIKGKYM